MAHRKKQKQPAPVGANARPGGEPPRRQLTLSFWIAAALLCLVVWAVYSQAIDAPFIFDDYSAIVANPSIKSLWPLVGDAVNPGPLRPPPYLPTSARPLVNLSFALNYAAGELDPAGYRAVNITLHMLSAILLGGIVLRTFRFSKFSHFATAAAWLAMSIAFLWAIHPLQTETVVYATQRTELVMAFLYLATLYCSLRYWEISAPAARAGWLALAVAACAAGMFSKEVMVSAPLMVLLFERTFVAGSLGKAVRQSWPLYAGLFSTWAILVFLNLNNPHGDVAGFDAEAPLLATWFTQAKIALMYFKLALWPWPLQIHYEVPYLDTLADAWPYLLVVTMLGGMTLVLLWRNHPLGYLASSVFVILSPTSLVPIITEVAAERRMYLPLAAIVAMVVIGGYLLAGHAVNRLGPRRSADARRRSLLLAAGIPIGVVAAAFTMVSGKRVAAFQEPIKLWYEVVQRQPKNCLAHQNLGGEMLRAGRLEEAIEWYQRAIKIDPENPQAHYNLGLIFLRSDRLDAAIAEFREAIRLEPDVAQHRNNLGAAFFNAKRYREAAPHFRKAFELDPLMWLAHDNLAQSLAMQGQYNEAVAHYERAVEINPKALEVYGHLADAYARSNRPAEAIGAAERALKLARAEGNDDVAGKITAQLAAYRAALANRNAPN
jgi:tetratricopeptide (TPR) repeat protein